MKYLSIFAAGLVPGTALSHPGDHAQAPATHLLTAPDHLTLVALIVAAGFGVWLWHRGRS